jgi:hypothetical protein
MAGAVSGFPESAKEKGPDGPRRLSLPPPENWINYIIGQDGGIGTQELASIAIEQQLKGRKALHLRC